jgi:hypothetical protein
VAGRHVRRHLAGRHGRHLHVAQRVDAAGGQPVIQEHRVVPGREGVREGEAPPAPAHLRGQRRQVAHALRRQRARQRDGLAVARQVHQQRHARGGGADAGFDAI